MSIITIDFETYYDKDYSLSKMTTEEYINDPRFEVIGVGIKLDDNESVWHTETEFLKNFAWEDHAILCHNTLFDGAILAFKYGIIPAFYFDTLSMARALHGTNVGGSLKALASKYKIGEKGDEVVQAIGKRRSDFTEVELERYGAYCRNDVDLTHSLFNCLQPFPDTELKLIDLTIRMYTCPVLQIDDAMLVDRLEHVKAKKQEMLAGLMKHLRCDNEEDVRKKLASNKQFAEILTLSGIDPPVKTSITTGKQTLALAKTDEGFIALQEHPDPIVQQLCAVRLGTKSTIEESRIERFISIGARNRGYLPVPLRYYGAHTGRWSGMDAVNFQNLPSRDKEKKTLKNAIVVPDGHYLINSDSSQIEARVLAWLAGQDDLLEQFAQKRDVYCEFASKIYDRPITKQNPIERFVGKTCILGLGYGTGAAKLQHTLKSQPPGVSIDLETAENYVSIYRKDNSRITALWNECERALKSLMIGTGEAIPIGEPKLAVWVDPDTGIQLPNGLYIRYPNLRTNEENRTVYDSRNGIISIWGGAVVENIVQALARIIVGEQMLWIAKQFHVALTVHDSVVCVVPEKELANALEYIQLCMSTPPAWATGLPVACEAKYGKSYGEC